MMTQCIRCSIPVEIIDLPNSLPQGAYCLDCIEAMHKEERQRQYRRVRDVTWETICPERYRDTELSRLPLQERSLKALAWKPNGGTGLNLWGFPDTGKTRTMILVLRSCHEQRKSIKLFEAGMFAEACEAKDFATGAMTRALVDYDILAFDDMDKMSLTRHQEMLFFAIIDRRMSRCRPTFFTHNSTAEELEYRFRSGESLVRRLRQFCSSIHFPARSTKVLAQVEMVY